MIRTLSASLVIALVGLVVPMAPAMADGIAPVDGEDRVAALRAEILALAERYEGEGDPDFTRQRRLETLVAELLRANPQPPVSERLDLLHGAWRQVWGPYDYRSDEARGVDPATDPERIYQIVFPSGFYYNVSPRDVRDTGPVREIVLLKGEYRLLDGDDEILAVRFVEFTKTKRPVAELDRLWPLAARAAAGTLDDRSSVLPGFLVRLFFGGGGLREVYTDEILRVTYGGRDLEERDGEFIYIMRRVGGAADDIGDASR